MKLQVLQENLSKALTTTSRFASPRVQLPVLANVMLSTQKSKLFLSATNLEMSVSVSIGAKVASQGKLTVPSRTLTDLVLNLSSETVRLDSKREHLEIVAPGFSSVVSGMNVSDFPSVPQTVPVKSMKLPKDDLMEALSRVLFAVSSDETRPVLTGVLFIMGGKKLTLVATDGFRLSQKSIVLGKQVSESNLVLPKNALMELVRLADGEDDVRYLFQQKENQVIFGVSNSVLTSRIIEGEFPDYKKIIPSASDIKVDVDKDDLLRAIKLASVFARDSANVVKMTLLKDAVEISAESQQKGSQQSKVEAKIEGELPKEGFVIAFNFRFLEDYLNVVKGDDVQMEFSKPNAPVVFGDVKDKDFLHIIMPVRIES